MIPTGSRFTGDSSARTPHRDVPANRSRSQRQDPGDSSGEATPVPIPNTVVKLSSAEDTEVAAPREHRPSPGSFRFLHTSLRRSFAWGLAGWPIMPPMAPDTRSSAAVPAIAPEPVEPD